MTPHGLYYNRQGEPMTPEEFATLMENPESRRVADTTLPDGKWVSTVHLGLDHGFGTGAPVIFETMVFPSQAEPRELDSDRYCTEAEARAGHARMVEKWTKGGTP
jgi:hypothetical protein